MTLSAELARANWDAAVANWQRARCADWHPQKAADVETARQACAAARRAYYGALANRD
jgi:hypothetical protein